MSWSVLAGISMPLTRRTLPPVRLPPFVAAGPADIAMPVRPAAPIPSPVAIALAPARRHITITADDVEVRDIIEEIARVTGYNVIVGTQVSRRVSAALFDVPAEAAVRSIADVAGLLVLPPSTPGGAAIVMQNKASSIAVRLPEKTLRP
jgi:type II secretory pathway component GspD/PulD (secretin)